MARGGCPLLTCPLVDLLPPPSPTPPDPTLHLPAHHSLPPHAIHLSWLMTAHRPCPLPLCAPSRPPLLYSTQTRNAHTPILFPSQLFFLIIHFFPFHFPHHLSYLPLSSSIFFYYSTVPRSSPGIHYLTKLFQGNHSSLNFYNVSFVITS